MSFRPLFSFLHYSLVTVLLAFGGVGEYADRMATEASCPHPDYAGLMALYNSTNGPGWTDNTGWVDGAAMTNCDPCSGWYGVSCDGAERVTSINLDSGSSNTLISSIGGNGLSGTLPTELEQLSFLIELDLDRNGIFGPIPASLGNLPSLQNLNLAKNNLSGIVPTSLGSLPDLRELHLNENNLDGDLPIGLADGTTLRELWVQQNFFTGTLPISSNNTGLRELYAGNNQLSGELPQGLFELPSIREIHLNDNLFIGCFPSGLSRICDVGFTLFTNNVGYNFTNNLTLPFYGDYEQVCNGIDQIGADCEIGNAGMDPETIQADCSCTEVSPCPTISPAAALTSCSTFDLTEAEPELTNGQTGVTVNWYENGALIPPANRTAYTPPSGPFTIEAEVDNTTCTSAREEVTLTVTPSPAFSDPGLPATICEGQMIEVTMTISDGTPPYNGLFQIGMNTLNTMTDFGGGTYSFNFTLPVGSYDYSMAEFGSFTDAEGCQTAMGSGNDANLTVLGPPTATAPAIPPRCNDGLGNPIDLTQFNAQVGTGTVTWFEDQFGSGEVLDPTNYFVGDADFILYVNLEVDGCTSELASAPVQIDPVPAVFPAADLASCDGLYNLVFAEAELTGGAGGVFVNWYDEGGNVINDPTVYDAAGAGFVSAEVSDGTCPSPRENVSLSAPTGGFLSVSEAVLPTGVCAGQEVFVTVQITGGTAPYAGSFAAGNEVLNSFSDFGGGTYTFMFSLPAGSYSTAFFSDVQDAGGCFASNSAAGGALVITPGPTTSQPNPAPVCFNGTDNVINLTDYDVEVGGGAQVQWFVDEQGTVPVDGPESVEFERGQTAVYGSVTVDGCTTIQPVTFEVFDVDQLNVGCTLSEFATLGEADGSIRVTLFGGQPPYVLTYDGTISGNVPNPTPPNLTVGNLEEGIYTFTLTDENGCVSTCSATVTTDQDNGCDTRRDSMALVDIYRSNNDNGEDWINTTTSGSGWETSGSNWLEDGLPFREWEGITVGPNGCVTILDLDGDDNSDESVSPGGIGMIGPLPEAIGQLSNLQYLYLTDNFYLTGGFPSSFYNLDNLLHVFANNVEFDAPISADLAEMDELIVLVANFNELDFEDVLPGIPGYAAILGRDGVVALNPQDSVYDGSFHQLDEGEPLTVDLGILAGDDRKVYRWYRDDVLEQEVTGGTGLLSFAALQTTDAGVYFCRVSHPEVPDFELLARAVEIIVNDLPDCNDGMMNGEETGVDCGGPDCGACDDACPNPDYAPLMALYISTTGDGWIFNGTNDDPSSTTAGWGKDCDVCGWYGVRCNENDRVTHLDLDGGVNFSNGGNFGGNGLTGVLPEQLQLPDLELLSLDENELGGEVPDYVGLPLLCTFSAGLNNLTGEIPDFRSMPALVDLELGNNLLMGPIPDFSGLPMLRRMNLSYNNLSGNIPDFSGIPDLESLFLSHNNLFGEIPDFTNLSSLERLRLEHNSLTGEIPDFSNLPLLTLFAADNNALTSNVTNFSNLSNLEFLELSHNNLFGELPDFSAIPALVTLGLSHNNISGSIPNFTGIGALETLGLSNNLLAGRIPELEALTNLNNFVVEFNNLSGCYPSFSCTISNFNSASNLSLPYEGDHTQVCDNGLPEVGASCNDNNPETENDMIDVDCNCTGTVVCPTVDVELTGENVNGVLGSEVCFTISADTFPDLNRLSFSANFSTSLLAYNRFVSAAPEGESSVSLTELADGNLGVTWTAGMGQSYMGGEVPVITLCFEVLSVEEAVVGLTNRPAGISSFVSPDCNPDVVASTFSVVNEGIVSACNDEMLNGRETGVDCGGPDCGECACEHPDLNALLTIYERAGGTGWNDNAGWAAGALGESCTPCTWLGVSCNEQERVISLVLENNNLVGRLPDEIQELTFLRELIVTGNPLLSGGIPSDLENLDSLRTLTLANNDFIETVRSTLGQLEQLVTLELQNNRLTGPIPDDLGNLQNLTRLNLSNNMLSGELNNELGEMSSLMELDLRNNPELFGCFPESFRDYCGRLASLNITNSPGLAWGGDFSNFCEPGSAQLGAPCNDNNPETTGETIQEDCSCQLIIPCPEVFAPVSLQVCAGENPLNLRQKDEEVLNGQTGPTVNWYTDIAATEPVTDATAFPVAEPGTTLYARTDNGVCLSDSVALQIVIGRPGTLSCLLEGSFLTVNLSGSSVVSYQLEIMAPGGGGETINLAAGAEQVYTVVAEGEYTVRVTDNFSCGEDVCTVTYSVPPTCNDGILNGNETQVDCGGPDCPPCTCVSAQMIDTTLCETDQIIVNEAVYDINNPSGTETILTPGACDTVVTINLGFYPPVATEEDFRDLCAGDTIFINGIEIVGDFAEEIVIPNRFGCDSVRLMLDVMLVTTDTINDTLGLCPGEIRDFFGQIIRETGSYEQYEPATDGACDVLYRLEVTEPFLGRSTLRNDSFALLRSDDFINLDLIGNDSLAAGALIVINNLPQKGRVVGNQVLGYRYRPDGESTGIDSFTYNVCLPDCPQVCSEAAVYLDVDFNCLVELTEKLPNTITPNGDGKNDLFDPRAYSLEGCDFSLMRMHIFNRWGQKIFSPAQYLPWPGTDNAGRALGVDTYFYVLEVEEIGEVRGEVDIVLRE